MPVGAHRFDIASCAEKCDHKAARSFAYTFYLRSPVLMCVLASMMHVCALLATFSPSCCPALVASLSNLLFFSYYRFRLQVN
jgi:hypothetical protein